LDIAHYASSGVLDRIYLWPELRSSTDVLAIENHTNKSSGKCEGICLTRLVIADKSWLNRLGLHSLLSFLLR
jgi:hypothetical protein